MASYICRIGAILTMLSCLFISSKHAELMSDSHIFSTIDCAEVTSDIDTGMFDEKIIFRSSYVQDNAIMPYLLFSPVSVPRPNTKHVLVWLHGSGEVGAAKAQLESSSLPALLSNWQLCGTNIYIICPHLTGNFNYGSWSNEKSVNAVKTLIEEFISSNNIPEGNVYLAGHSLGGYGSLYVAERLDGYFNKVCVISGYRSSANEDCIPIPVIGFVGSVRCGEDSRSVHYMSSEFTEYFGGESVTFLDCSHAKAPKTAFSLDSNGNGRSDIFEWLIEK